VSSSWIAKDGVEHREAVLHPVQDERGMPGADMETGKIFDQNPGVRERVISGPGAGDRTLFRCAPCNITSMAPLTIASSSLRGNPGPRDRIARVWIVAEARMPEDLGVGGSQGSFAPLGRRVRKAGTAKGPGSSFLPCPSSNEGRGFPGSADLPPTLPFITVEAARRGPLLARQIDLERPTAKPLAAAARGSGPSTLKTSTIAARASARGSGRNS